MGFWKSLFRSRPADVSELLRRKYASFRRLLTTNNEILREITELEGVLTGEQDVTQEEMRALTGALQTHIEMMVDDLNVLAEGQYLELRNNVSKIAAGIEDELRQVHGGPITRLCLPLEEIVREYADAVGGKTSNLGEVRNRIGLPVPPGFTITTEVCTYY